jgi:hypothetical protein
MDFAAWHEMAKYEACAPVVTPVITPQKPVTRTDLIQKVQREKMKYSSNRTSLVVFLVTAAAVVFLVYWLIDAACKRFHVAVLSDSIHAKWQVQTAKRKKVRHFSQSRVRCYRGLC